MKIIRTRMLTRYMIKFFIRLGIFISVLVAYITHKSILIEFMTHKFTFGISQYGIRPLHILWALFMLMMLRHLFPPKVFTMALLKEDEEIYQPEEYDPYELLKFVQDANVRAWTVLLVWLCGNAVVALLYLFQVIDVADMLMITVFYFLCDYICIIFFCPFQTFIMKNKCCVNCRIYEWGHFMMFTPMLFIRNFFSWSLFFTAVVVLLRWELIYANHPERFWSGANKNLQCKNCKDKTCQIKKAVKKTVTSPNH